jgi:hypothetical protein
MPSMNLVITKKKKKTELKEQKAFDAWFGFFN